jgi:hypothetical protein
MPRLEQEKEENHASFADLDAFARSAHHDDRLPEHGGAFGGRRVQLRQSCRRNDQFGPGRDDGDDHPEHLDDHTCVADADRTSELRSDLSSAEC